MFFLYLYAGGEENNIEIPQPMTAVLCYSSICLPRNEAAIWASLVSVSSITGQYADVLYRGTGLAVIVTDRDCVIACAGISL